MRYFYYLECKDEDKVFEYLNDYVDNKCIVYTVEDVDGVIVITNKSIDDDDEFFDKLKKFGLIEEDYITDAIDDGEDYDDFYNEEDYE